jgi:hypothetical protein
MTTLSPQRDRERPTYGDAPGVSRVPRVAGLGRRGWLVATLLHGGMLLWR